MAVAPSSDDQFADMTFPLGGVSLDAEFQGQPPFTTIVGTNVGTFETLTGRGRGGSRCGLSKFIDEAVS